jgi:transposase
MSNRKTLSSQPTILSKEKCEELLSTLKSRFEKNMIRHQGITWANVLARLESNPGKLLSLYEMENTGGEPDVVSLTNKLTNKNTEQKPGGKNEYYFIDCSLESPSGRRSLCYDGEALASRKENKPKASAVGMADAMGIELVTEEQYRALQTLGDFDTKTSSWIKTPAAIRQKGGALFCDHRYGNTFVYHNGAESYYAARGFRGLLKV